MAARASDNSNRLRARTHMKKGQQGGERPSAVLVGTASLLLLMALVFALMAGVLENAGFSLVGFLTGSVLGTANLAAFLVVDTKRRAGKKFADWPISAKTITKVLTLASWAVGAWNIFFWALEWTRP